MTEETTLYAIYLPEAEEFAVQPYKMGKNWVAARPRFFDTPEEAKRYAQAKFIGNVVSIVQCKRVGKYRITGHLTEIE